MERLKRLFKTTAMRLTVIYLLLFSALALSLVFYVSQSTGQLILSQIRSAADDEVRELATIYRRGGARNLIRSIERRSRNPGSNLYLVSDTNGRIITGNVKNVDAQVLQQTGWSKLPFPYVPFNQKPGATHRAIAKNFELQGNLRLLVGRDVGDAVGFREIVKRATTFALVMMLITGVLLWFFIGRRALRRVDEVSAASARILAGDLSERLPMSGSSDEFDRLSENLNALIERLEKLNLGVRDVSDAIAHDLKTPLSRLRNEAGMALSNAGAPKKVRIENLEKIVAQADGLIDTFSALAMVSQIGSGAKSVEFTQVNVELLLRNVCELFEPVFDETGVKFLHQISPGLSINGNAELLSQSLVNVIDNAVKYGLDADEAALEICLYEDQGKVVIEIADNGRGIPTEALESVKERFFRLDESRKSDGSGLGLALVDAIVKLHKGDFELLDNAPGVRAQLRFPA